MNDLAGLPKSIIKRYGISKKAWEVYRSQHKAARPASTGGKKMVKRRRASSIRKKRAKRGGGGRKIIGNLGLKGLLIGGGLTVLADMFIPPIGGAYSPALKLMAAGAGAKAIGAPGAMLMSSGAMLGAATAIRQLLSGGIKFNGGGGGNGYDY